MLSYMCDFYLLFSAAWMRAFRDTFIQVLVANTQYFVPQAILDFLPNIIQTYRISRKPPRPPRPTTFDPRPSTFDFNFVLVLSLFIKFRKQYQVNVGSPSATLA